MATSGQIEFPRFITHSQWDGLPHIDEIIPMSESDSELVGEVRAVLEKHGALRRFGLTLLHHHFSVADDEVMVESCDPVTRTLTSKPHKAANVPLEQTIQTSWRLDTLESLMKCTDVCRKTNAGHTGDHAVTR